MMTEMLNFLIGFLSEFLWIYLPVTVLVVGFLCFIASLVATEENKKEQCKKLGVFLLWASVAVFFAFPCVVFFWMLST